MYEEPNWVNNAKTVLKMTFLEPISLEEVVESSNKASALLDTVDHPVQMIVDLLGVQTMPRNFISNFPMVSRLPLVNHRNLDVVINVMDNSFMEAVASIFSRMYRKVNFVRTLDDAYKAANVEQSTH